MANSRWGDRRGLNRACGLVKSAAFDRACQPGWLIEQARRRSAGSEQEASDRKTAPSNSPNFKGRVLVNISPDLKFSNIGRSQWRTTYGAADVALDKTIRNILVQRFCIDEIVVVGLKSLVATVFKQKKKIS